MYFVTSFDKIVGCTSLLHSLMSLYPVAIIGTLVNNIRITYGS